METEYLSMEETLLELNQLLHFKKEVITALEDYPEDDEPIPCAIKRLLKSYDISQGKLADTNIKCYSIFRKLKNKKDIVFDHYNHIDKLKLKISSLEHDLNELISVIKPIVQFFLHEQPIYWLEISKDKLEKLADTYQNIVGLEK
jgi:hypothetical protein